MAETKVRAIRIEDDLWKELQEASAEEHRTASQTIRWLIEDWLDRRD